MVLLSFLYWPLISLYLFAIKIAALFNAKAKLFINGRKHWQVGMQQALAGERRKTIWVHCASLGEFEQGRPIIERLKAEHEDFAIILTFFSPSGYEVRKDYTGADYVFYLPVDTIGNAGRFLDITHPTLCLFVKYEFWFGYLNEIKKRGLPALLISAIFRPEQSFFKWHGVLQRYMLRCFAQLFVQNQESVNLLSKIKMQQVVLSGDSRFDRVLELWEKRQSLAVLEDFCKGGTIIVAGSTWKADEVFLENVLQKLPKNTKLVLVPHEVHEAHLKEIEQLFQGKTMRYSEYQNGGNKQVLLVDAMGILGSIYAYGQYAWIGGAFNKAGVHNVLEAAVYAIPVAHGPIYHKFQEAVALNELKGSQTFQEAVAYANWLKTNRPETDAYLAMAKQAAGYVRSKAGATGIIIKAINECGYLK